MSWESRLVLLSGISTLLPLTGAGISSDLSTDSLVDVPGDGCL